MILEEGLGPKRAQSVNQAPASQVKTDTKVTTPSIDVTHYFTEALEVIESMGKKHEMAVSTFASESLNVIVNALKKVYQHHIIQGRLSLIESGLTKLQTDGSNVITKYLRFIACTDDLALLWKTQNLAEGLEGKVLNDSTIKIENGHDDIYQTLPKEASLSKFIGIPMKTSHDASLGVLGVTVAGKDDYLFKDDLAKFLEVFLTSIFPFLVTYI
jgi:hypothetical protein